jgi:hypothetical protein
MNKRALLLGFAAMAVVWPMISSAQVTIPRTRLRIVYQETGQPVEWVRLSISCWAKWRSKAEKKAYQEKIGGWEASKETTYGGGRFLHAEDGWITIPEVSNVRMDSYEIEITPAAGRIFYVTDPRRYNQEIHDNNYSHLLPYYDEKTFPKFAAVPEKDRMLEASFSAAIPPGTLNRTYEEARFFLATYEIVLKHWPRLAPAQAYYGGKALERESFYWGAIDDFLTAIFFFVDPSICSSPGLITPLTDAQRADLMERIRSLFCTDIETKLKLWGETSMPLQALFRESDLFQHCWESLRCENIDAEGRLVEGSKPPGGPSVPAQEKHTAPATPTPSAASPPQSPPTEAPDKH